MYEHSLTDQLAHLPTQRAALVAIELGRYAVDTAALSVSNFSGDSQRAQ